MKIGASFCFSVVFLVKCRGRFIYISVYGWNGVFNWILSLKGENFRGILSRLPWNAFCLLPLARNEYKVFGKNARDEEALIHQIKESVSFRLTNTKNVPYSI